MQAVANSIAERISSISVSSTMKVAADAEKLLHDLATLRFQHAGGNFNAMIQKIRIANSKPRLNRSGPFVERAIHQPFHSRLDQCARTHDARLDR